MIVGGVILCIILVAFIMMSKKNSGGSNLKGGRLDFTDASVEFLS
jgi:preprotein translocase subunit SecG